VPAAKPVQTEKTDVAKPEVTEGDAAEKTEVTESKPVEPPTSQPQAQGNAKFAIVLASYVNQKNAETFIELLKKNGYKDARFVENGKTTRILYSGYVTREDAQAALGTLRKESTFFSDGWILEL
jgi:cell division septation protein DedD